MKSFQGVLLAHIIYLGSKEVQELLNLLIQSAVEFPDPGVRFSYSVQGFIQERGGDWEPPS